MDRIPILKMGEFLVVSVQEEMHDRLARTLQEELSDRVYQTSAKGVLIDISTVEIVDSFIGRMIANIAGISGIMDARTVIPACNPPWPSPSSRWVLFCRACSPRSTLKMGWSCCGTRRSQRLESRLG